MSLYIVATPIGNLADMTYRAVETLTNVKCVYAEDTRISRRLLDHYSITTPLARYHDFNKERMIPKIMELLREGDDIAIISDAGTPGIADPAFNVVREALREGVPVVPIPGASAHITALVASGLPTDRFVFENFLPHKSAARRRLFETLREEPRTIIFYETPHRIIKVLNELNDVLGDIAVVIGREMTKMYEEFLRGTPKMLLEHFEKKKPRGEMVVLINIRIRELFESSESDTNDCNEDGDLS